jgi:hypothetical protein
MNLLGDVVSVEIILPANFRRASKTSGFDRLGAYFS